MAFELDIGFTSLAGTKDVNEDFAAAMLPEAGQAAMGAIAAIADGVSTGGHGREAAQTTVTSLVRDYFGTPETWDTTVALDRIIAAQNSWLAALNHRRHPACGLTTLTALVLRGHGYSLAHVGDTRAYLVRGDEVTQLTHDHAMDHPDLRSALLRAVGAEERLVVDYSQGEMQVGDVFVLVSDGVHRVLPAKKFGVLPEETAQAASQALVDAALAAGSRDNATAMVVRVLGVDDAGLQDLERGAQQLPVPPKLKVGDAIDGYTVTALVADNGINLLYQVRDATTRKLHALKALHPSRAHDAQERAMLAHEAWLAARMRTSRARENLVALHETPQASAFYLVYDWHAGETLQQLLDRRQPMGVAQVVSAATQVARALGRLHRQGVIHRDVKPANLHQGEDGVLRLLDLGVALSGREPEAARLLHAGTPSYMNPEQWNEPDPEPPDAQSDLFALGVTLYQLLARGKLPYGEVLPYQAGRYWRDPVPPSRHNPQVPIWLDHIALKAVSRDKKQRFETAEEFLLALERGASRPLTAPPPTPLVRRDPTALWKIALAVSVLLNVLLVYWLLFLPK
ncbi:bifunctional protein-serine/threonine kinase/phosphatase [Ramlibacter albus]|uniref:Bifunctional protein-serine/threonine kinase/phosphatase n=1 Tax=Ramlibacter albus TaxID=2079448 RepID=A0A923S7J3_9BURK|nr:bifunctional protein-serine/threonine kinase/phosphatase [Ramlibacter albus]MBC5767182.1 bifunctional protein-serine/threonine kinase/phosphatase [Ramlibacter albus]